MPGCARSLLHSLLISSCLGLGSPEPTTTFLAGLQAPPYSVIDVTMTDTIIIVITVIESL